MMTMKFSIGAALLFISAQTVFGCPVIVPADLQNTIQTKINHPTTNMTIHGRRVENVRPRNAQGNEQNVLETHQQYQLRINKVGPYVNANHEPNVCAYLATSITPNGAQDYQFTFTLGN